MAMLIVMALSLDVVNKTFKNLILNSLAAWPDLAKFFHFGQMLYVFGNFSRSILFLANFLTYFGNFVWPLGIFSLQ